jgi:predicted ATP-dependent serine protease
MSITNQIVYLKDFAEEAEHLSRNYGQTNLFSTGIERLDRYLYGGFGRREGYEIVLLFGPTGVGKSLVGLNFLADPLKQGHKIGLLVLEDDGADVYLRFRDILKNDQGLLQTDQIVFVPPRIHLTSWNLDDLLEYIERWYTKFGVDLILVDHLQFAFENAATLQGENEYINQRVFMQKLNQLIKRLKKTIILVSHVHKQAGKGMEKVVGSSALVQASTKVIEIQRHDVTEISLRLWKSRFTKTPPTDSTWQLDGAKLRDHLIGRTITNGKTVFG